MNPFLVERVNPFRNDCSKTITSLQSYNIFMICSSLQYMNSCSDEASVSNGY